MPYWLADSRFLSNPHPVVNHAADMFCELTIDIRRNLPQRLVQKDLNASVGVLRPDTRLRKSKHSACDRRALEKLSSFHGNSLSFPVRELRKCIRAHGPLAYTGVKRRISSNEFMTGDQLAQHRNV